MRKLIALLGAVILFLASCFVLNKYYDHILNDKKIELTYYNNDSRNSCLQAMDTVINENSIPVFGSSELSASDEVAYPPYLFQNGMSDFNMILIGRGNMQSLHHAVNVGAMETLIPNRKVVLILSPQWFTASHLSSEAYSSRFSERAYSEFVRNTKLSYSLKEKVTERVKSLLEADPKQKQRVEKYENVFINHSLNPALYLEMKVYDAFMDLKQKYLLSKETKSTTFESKKGVEIEKINFSELMSLAERAGKEACTNNNLYIYDEYYNKYVQADMEKRKGTEISSSYQVSPEYDDLRLFLDTCKECEIEPLIVSIPVNGRWYDWTGFPINDRNAYYQNIRDICHDYGVNLVDYSDKEYEPYFLKDIMHLGWKGWVYLDEAVYRFCNGN